MTTDLLTVALPDSTESIAIACQWIAPHDVSRMPATVFRARQWFAVPQVPERFLIHIAAESIYHLWINGSFIGQGPARGTHAVNFYDTYDIAALMTAGDNIIAVLVACDNIPSFVGAPAEPALKIWSADHSLVTDSRWQVRRATDWESAVDSFTPQKGLAENRNLSAEPQGWQLGLDNAIWQQAQVLSSSQLIEKLLKPRDIPALRQHRHDTLILRSSATVPAGTDIAGQSVAQRMTDETHLPLPLRWPAGEPLIIDPPANGAGMSLIFDAEREIVSGFECDLTAPAGAMLDVGYAETIIDDRLRVHLGNRHMADRFVLRDGRQLVTPIHERGYRYIQLTFRNFHQPIRLHRLTGIDRTFPADCNATFHCSDDGLNRIWNACIETIGSCATDTFFDCPWRESALWICDLLVQNLTWLQTFADPRLPRRSLSLAFTQARDDGWVPTVCPVDKPGEWATLVSNLTIAIVVNDYILQSGDLEFLQEAMPRIERILSAARRAENADGLLTLSEPFWPFIEWSYTFAELANQTTAVANWYYVLALQSAGNLLRQMGQCAQADAYDQHARTVAERIDCLLWDDHRQCYAEWMVNGQPGPVCSQLSQGLALLSGLVHPERRRHLIAALDRADLRPPELFMTHMLLRAMVLVDEPGAALARIRRYWMPIIESGSPTIWEMNVHQHGASAFQGAGSVCHAFATTPVDFCQRIILGVTPVTAGFDEFRFKPHTLGLASAYGSIPTPHGPIEVEWKQADDSMTAIIVVPPNTTALLCDGVRLPAGRHRLNFAV